jgi:hypothetical protein
MTRRAGGVSLRTLLVLIATMAVSYVLSLIL